MPVQRYKLTIMYRGTNYHGWQTQGVSNTWKGEMPPPGEGIPTVQQKLRRVIENVVKHEINLVGSSRTDSGVHAKGQVAHFDTDQLQIPPESIRRSVNDRLPEDILVTAVEPVSDRFDAIYSTVKKRYQYLIWNDVDRPALTPDLMWHRRNDLSVEAMLEGASKFVGTHDFATFARPGHRRFSTVRTVHSFDITKRGPRLVFGVEGSGFLWHMVRIMVGTLVEVGMGRYGPDTIRHMIDAKDRQAGGLTAPPQGLYLQWIQFGEKVSVEEMENEE